MGALTQESITLRNTASTAISLNGPIYVTAHDGLGMVKPNRARQRGPYQHGYTLTNATLGDRVVTLKLAVDGVDDSATAVQARALVALLNNLNEALYLDVTSADGLTKRLDVYYQDGLRLPHEAAGLYGDLPDVVQLVADDPIAYSVELTTVRMAYSGGGTGMPIPLIMPWTLGASVLDELAVLGYAGTWGAYPKIRFVGPLEDPILQNHTTGETLSFNGTHIAAAHWFEVDCAYGVKTVIDNHGVNQLGALTAASDLGTFHIAPADEAVHGSNEFHIVATGITAATYVSVSYYTMYLSAL